MQEEMRRMNTAKRVAICSVLIFFVLILAVVVSMTVKTDQEMGEILEDSVRSQLISVSMAARALIDVDEFASYNSAEDVMDNDAYAQTLQKLRVLCQNIGAEYIYALKEIDGKYVFVFDTDTEDEAVFIPYDIAPVHALAFKGISGADVMNVDDIYGSFNTGAVPLVRNGTVIGIVSTDIADVHIKESQTKSRNNAALLLGVLIAMMCAMMFILFRLINKLNKMQLQLERQAHYDTITGLPNRQYLFEYLARITSKKNKAPYALLFIDLDNFKRVNDTAGHDAGDLLLQNIATFLEKFSGEDGIAFRPAAGKLNISARIGGDEFIQVISGIENEEDAVSLGERLLSEFREEFSDRYVDKFNVGLSVGIALCPYHAPDYHVLIKYADIAMYHAKNSGKNRCCVYSDELEQKLEK